MNERIKELIDQCSEYDEMSLGIWFNKEKFAELIVKECLSIVKAQKECLTENSVYWNDHDYGYEMAVNDSVDMVKTHFGVEE